MFNFTGAQTFLLASGIGSSDVTILLESFAEPITGTKYTMSYLDTDIVYATLSPKTTSTEFISFTGITQNGDSTATLTGVVRGLSRSYPYTTNASYKVAHSGQSQLILSNSPQFYEEFMTKRNDETISGIKTFSVSPIVPAGATGTQAVNYAQAAALIAGGVADASTTVAGKVLKPSQAEVDAKSATGNDGGSVSRTLMVTPDTLRSTKLSDYVADGGTTNAYAITPVPAITAYAVGQIFSFIAAHSNTAASTLAVSGLAATSIKKNYTITLEASDILASQIVTVEYDGTNFQMLSPTGNQQEYQKNKDTTVTLGTSDILYPSQKAVKTYVDTNAPVNHANGTTTYDLSTASGVTTIAHGMARVPKKVRFTFTAQGVTVVSFLFAAYNGTTTSTVGVLYAGATIQQGMQPGTSILLYSLGGTNSNYQTGVITFDATNIYITWTKTSSPTGVYSIMWEAQ